MGSVKGSSEEASLPPPLPPPTPQTRTELVTVLQEEWLKIPMQTMQDLYQSFSGRVAAVLAAKGALTAY